VINDFSPRSMKLRNYETYEERFAGVRYEIPSFVTHAFNSSRSEQAATTVKICDTARNVRCRNIECERLAAWPSRKRGIVGSAQLIASESSASLERLLLKTSRMPLRVQDKPLPGWYGRF